MSKHYRTAGVDSKNVTIQGKAYILKPLTVGVYASMESFIVDRRPDPLQIASSAIAKLPASQHDAVWRAAMHQAVAARTVTAEEAAAFENSVDGLAWKLWQCAKDNHPEVNSIESAKSLLIAAGESHFEELARATEIASGDADLKKSSGQDQGTEAVLAGQ
jgi:hypothetical protein